MLNFVSITGRLTKDPELRTTQSGTTVATFTIACERDLKNHEGKRETDYFDCVAWRSTGEFVAKTFHKGDGVSVTGRLQTRQYTDHDGNKRRATEIMVSNCYFQLTKAEVHTQTGTMPIIVDDDPDGLPF